jgi:hypothetical protein
MRTGINHELWDYTGQLYSEYPDQVPGLARFREAYPDIESTPLIQRGATAKCTLWDGPVIASW